MKRPKFPPLALICVDAALAVWAVPVSHPEVEGRLMGYIVKIRRKSIIHYGYQVSEVEGTAGDFYPTPREAAVALLTVLGGRPALAAESLTDRPAA